MGVAVVVALTVPVVAADDVIDATQPLLAPVAPVPVYAAGVDATAPHRPPNGGGPEDINTFSQIVSADVTTNGVVALDNVALILDRDGSDNLYIKVQGQSGGGKFDAIGFYHGAGAGGWTGMTGGFAFFTLAAPDQFTSAHMTVIHDGVGNVTLQLTNVVGGTNNQTYTRGGWVPRFAAGVGYGGFAGGYSVDNWGHDTLCDDFNRANGPLGVDWVTTDGTSTITGNTARGSGTSRSIYVGACGGGLAVAEADVGLAGAGLDYAALVLNADSGDNLFIKVQRQAASLTYNAIGFYHGLNGFGWAGQTGGVDFIVLPAAQEFTSAHMKVIMEANGNVRLILTDLDTVVGPLEFSRGAWPVRNGHAAGIGGFASNARMDNFSVSGLGVLDSFNRPNGGLGPNWQLLEGTGGITGGSAGVGSGVPGARALFTSIPGNTLTCPADSAPPGGDDVVDVLDLLKVINSWGACP